MNHIAKCKWLYENAKVIYTDFQSSFDVVAENLGIPVVNIADTYTKQTTYVDGVCRERIMRVIESMIGDKLKNGGWYE